MSRRHNLRLIKAHLNYTAVELADTLAVNVTTVRVWTQQGLRPIAGTRPYLFAPVEVCAFLKARMKPKRRLAPGDLLCVACKEHRRPAGDVVDLIRRSETSVDLVGDCPVCRRRMHRRAALSKLGDALGTVTVRYEDASLPYWEKRERAPVPLLVGADS